MKSVFLVKTPLQLLNAIEARVHFGLAIEDCVMVVMGDRKSLPQMQELVARFSEWGCVIKLAAINPFFGDPLRECTQQRETADTFDRSLFYIWQLNRLAKALGELEYVFIGYARYAYMKHFMNVSHHRRLVFLDDGNVTLKLAREVRAGGLMPAADTLKKRLKLALRRRVAGLRDEDPERFCFFTVYDVTLRPQDEVISNDYASLRRRLGSQQPLEQAYFLGSPLGEGIIGLDAYIRHLTAVLDSLGGMEVLYVAHRRESPERLRAIEQATGLEVVRFEYPIEYQLIADDTRPAMIASFFSSALDSCHMIFGDGLDVRAFRLDVSASDRVADIEAIYDSYRIYEGEHFKVLSLDV